MKKILLFIVLSLNGLLLSAQTPILKIYNAIDANTYYLSTQKNYFIPFHVKETGTLFSSSVKYSYKINNGICINQAATVNHNGGTSNCVNAIGLSMYRIAFTTPVNFNAVGDYTIKVWIDSINGVAFNTTDTLIRKYKALNNLPSRKGLSEYYYHVACGPCGEDGTPYYDNLLENFEEYTVPVKLHNSYSGPAQWAILDRPEVQQLETTLNINGHPNFDFNRATLNPFQNSNHYYPYLGFCPLDSNFLTKDIIFSNKVPSELSISNVALNNSSNILSFTANTKFLDALTFTNEVRVSCMLVEDSIYSYQASNGSSTIDTVYHRYVLRKIYGGAFGFANSVPASVAVNQLVSINILDTLPLNFNKSRLHLIPIIQYFSANTNGYEVVNVKRFQINNLLNVTNIAEKNNQLRIEIYPNPAKDNLTVESNLEGVNLTVTVMDMVGRKLLSKTTKNNKISNISTSSLASGTYIISVSDGANTVNKQLIIE